MVWIRGTAKKHPTVYNLPVNEYAKKILVQCRVLSAGKGFRSPGWTDQDGFSAEAVEQIAGIVTAYHAWRHTPRAERGKDWPKDLESFSAGLGFETERVREAIYQARYHRWEEKYVPKVSREARVSQIKDSLLHNVLRQDTVEDASKVNANLYRTALQSEGAIEGTKKVTQVNIGSNVVNMPDGMTREKLASRVETLNRLARKLNAREVDVGVEAGSCGLLDSAVEQPDGTGGAQAQGNEPE